MNYFTQICLALKHIHDRKIMHRDIKPHNVFLTRRGICKLGDFGVSKVLNKTRSKAQTLIGTPVYLAPEIILGKGYDMKSDMWAIGIVLYEMMALKSPWTASSLGELGQQISRGKYPPLPEGYSNGLKNIV